MIVNYCNSSNISYPLITTGLLAAAAANPDISRFAVEQIKMLAAKFFDNFQCFSLLSLETDLKYFMKIARNTLLISKEEGQKFGNKQAGLAQMGRINQVLDLPDLKIPFSKGIANDDIAALLRKKAPEFFVHRNELTQLYSKHVGPSLFLEQPIVKNHLNGIEEAIVRAFNQSEDLEALNISTKWLQENGATFLMLRSSGAEDSKKSANAGGNLSVAYVKPTPKDFMEAVRNVVKSHFSKTSLQNQINAGSNPFEEKLQLALTAQHLIGEPIGGAKDPNQIPVSFVLFTNEPLYIGQEKFRAMRLSASYGHGEGVVDSQGIATDTILILHSESHPDRLYTIYDNQKKTTRLAPVEQGNKVVLSRVSNPEHLIEKPSINRKTLNSIYLSGVVMESFFGSQATDIEGVLKEGKIYFVQARPIHRNPLLPTFLSEKGGVLGQIEGDVLVAGKASVIIVPKREKILIAPTLKAAERQFLTREANTYQLIVVLKEEPQNSHPVVNFSSLSVPCLYISDREQLEALLKKMDENHPLAACMQTGTLHLWDRNRASLEKSIQEGFAVHPAKIADSLFLKNSLTRQGVWGNEIEQIKAALQTLSSIPPEAKKRLNILRELHEKIETAKEETHAVLNTSKGRLQKLLHLKILDQYTHLDPIPLLNSLSTLIDYQRKLSHPAHAAEILLAAEQAAGPEAFTFFRTFLEKLEPLVENKSISPNEWKEFKKILSTLEKTGALSFWLTFLPKEPDAMNLFHQIRADIQASSMSAKAITYQVMGQTLDLLDTNLKQIKMSTDNDKVDRFKAMLKPYFKMMKSWSAMVPPHLITHHPLWPLERYLNQVEEILDALSGDLMPTQSFSVSAAILSAGTAFDRHLPKSLEDMLTLLHQNCLSWLAALYEDLLSPERIEESLLPETIKQAIRLVKEKRRGIEFRDKKMILTYNVPLNNHSGRIDLIYDLSSSKMQMQGYLLGQARGTRWSDTAKWAELLQDAGIFPAFQAPSIGGQEVAYSWDISLETLPQALSEYRAMAKYSLEQESYTQAMEALFDRWKDAQELSLLTQECLRKPDPAFHRFYERIAKTPEGSLSMLKSAEKAFKSTNSDLRKGALELYRQLVDREEAYEEALFSAKATFKSRDVGVIHSAIKLLNQLVDKGQIHDHSFSAAIKGSLSTEESIKLSALQTLFSIVNIS